MTVVGYNLILKSGYYDENTKNKTKKSEHVLVKFFINVRSLDVKNKWILEL